MTMDNKALTVKVFVPYGNEAHLTLTYDPPNPEGLVGKESQMRLLLGANGPGYVTDRPRNGISTPMGLFEIEALFGTEWGMTLVYRKIGPPNVSGY